MHGNIWEWCLDNWHGNYQGAPIDGSAWNDNNYRSRRVLRGGSWSSNPLYCRSAFRPYGNLPYLDEEIIGLRVVCIVVPRT